MDQTLTCYFAAWNETDAGKRGRLLQRSLSDDAELVDPTGRWRGVGGFSDRIARFHAAAPGTKVVTGRGVDAHNDVERYAWKIVDPSGNDVMEGGPRRRRARWRRPSAPHRDVPRTAACRRLSTVTGSRRRCSSWRRPRTCTSRAWP
jgi:hypothetical protein